MVKLSEHVKEGIAAITGAKTREEDIWRSSGWDEHRQACSERRKWYTGEKVRISLSGVKRDPLTNETPKLWPLEINLIKKFCRVHRGVMFGMQPETVELPVKTLVSRTGLEASQRGEAASVEAFLSRCWQDSSGASMMMEAGKLMQYYGGHVFQVLWEPYNLSRTYRIGICSHDTPAHLWPVAVDPTGRREILECYIGYEIEAGVARIKFGIDPGDKERVLYMEHWTQSEYRVTVDGKVPTFKREVDGTTFRQEGENPFGRVPVVYIPHDPSGLFWGESLVDDLTGMNKELNARMADKGDYVQESVPEAYVRNIEGSLRSRMLERDGRPTREVTDLGAKAPLPNAGEPELAYAETRGLPESTSRYTNEVLGLMLIQADVARVAVGEDDVSGGRITGPVTAYRMYPTMQHTFTERLDFSEGLTRLSELMVRLAAAKEEVFGRLGAPSPKMANLSFTPTYLQAWKPMIPIEKREKAQILNERLQAGGISVRQYLVESGVQDVEEEEERIWADRERVAELEQKAKFAAMADVGMFSGGGNRDEERPAT